MRESIVKNIQSPILNIFAFPFPYGEDTFNVVFKIVKEISENSTSKVEHIKFEKGGHHFHMLEPEECSQLVLKFLDENVKKNLDHLQQNNIVDLFNPKL